MSRLKRRRPSSNTRILGLALPAPACSISILLLQSQALALVGRASEPGIASHRSLPSPLPTLSPYTTPPISPTSAFLRLRLPSPTHRPLRCRRHETASSAVCAAEETTACSVAIPGPLQEAFHIARSRPGQHQQPSASLPRWRCAINLLLLWMPRSLHLRDVG